jgi:hypothetical protein
MPRGTAGAAGQQVATSQCRQVARSPGRQGREPIGVGSGARAGAVVVSAGRSAGPSRASVAIFVLQLNGRYAYTEALEGCPHVVDASGWDSE